MFRFDTTVPDSNSSKTTPKVYAFDLVVRRPVHQKRSLERVQQGVTQLRVSKGGGVIQEPFDIYSGGVYPGETNI